MRLISIPRITQLASRGLGQLDRRLSRILRIVVTRPSRPLYGDER